MPIRKTTTRNEFNQAVMKILTVKEAKTADVLWADGIIVGSPVYNANIAVPVQPGPLKMPR